MTLGLATVSCANAAGTKPTPTKSPTGLVSESPGSSSSPTKSGRAMPPLGILIAFANGTGPQSTGYDMSLVTAEGKVTAKVHAAGRSYIHTPGSGLSGAAAYDLPEVSASNTRVYY